MAEWTRTLWAVLTIPSLLQAKLSSVCPDKQGLIPLSQFTHNISLLPRTNLLQFFLFPSSFHLAYLTAVFTSPLFNTALEFHSTEEAVSRLRENIIVMKMQKQAEHCQSFLWWYCQLDGTVSICISAWELITYQTSLFCYTICPSTKDSLIMLLSCHFIFLSASPTKQQKAVCQSPKWLPQMVAIITIWFTAMVNKKIVVMV